MNDSAVGTDTSARRPTTFAELVGAIVLSTQDAEHWLKITLPFMNADDPRIGSALKRHERLKRQSFGELKKMFVDASDSNEGFVARLDSLVNRRNEVVHHFGEIYGSEIAAGRQAEAVRRLRCLLRDVDQFARMIQIIALGLFEAMRDTTFAETPEFEEFAHLCAQLREHAERPPGWRKLLDSAQSPN